MHQNHKVSLAIGLSAISAGISFLPQVAKAENQGSAPTKPVDQVAARTRAAEINRAIKAAGANWSASPASANLTRKGMGLSWNPNERLPPPTRAAASRSLQQYPTSITWAAYATPIRDQGGCGSCVAFATSAALEMAIKIAGKNIGYSPNPGLSEQQIFSCSNAANDCSTGSYIQDAFKFVAKKGVYSETLAPYTQYWSFKGNAQCVENPLDQMRSELTHSYPRAREAQIPNFYKPQDYQAIPADNLSLVAALQTGPVVVAIAVYDDFFNYRSGVYSHVHGNLAGYHALPIIGYDRNQRFWLVKNSWGPEWGDKGFARISWDDKYTLSTWSMQGLNAGYQFIIPKYTKDSRYFALQAPSQNREGDRQIVSNQPSLSVSFAGDLSNYVAETVVLKQVAQSEYGSGFGTKTKLQVSRRFNHAKDLPIDVSTLANGDYLLYLYLSPEPTRGQLPLYSDPVVITVLNPAYQPLPIASVEAHSALKGWEAEHLIHGDGEYSSNFHSGPNNPAPADGGEQVAVWFAEPKWITQIDIAARVADGRVQAFPSNYNVLVTNPQNTGWDLVGNFSTQPNQNGHVFIPIPGGAVQTRGIWLQPTALGQDGYGGYYLQLHGLSGQFWGGW